ncbi:hypothetical protein B7463_g7119, partial [Scytalidium lignicola]
MASSLQSRREGGASSSTSRRNGRNARGTNPVVQSAGIPPRLQRNDGKSAPPSSTSLSVTNSLLAESWVEISSQPSSSSLSSIGEEIVTTGLRVQTDRRRRRPQGHLPSQLALASRNEGTSSQEEYEESESEDDHALSSSNENISAPHFPPTSQQPYDAESESDDDDDENATALGMVSNEPAFRPQPNAFSHPPSSQNAATSRPSTDSRFTRSPAFQASSRPSHPRSRTSQAVSSNPPQVHTQADHDEALRASLTTLLSCAAAARGLPKQPTHYTQHSNPLEATAGRTTSAPNMEIRMVSESELTRNTANSSRPLTPSSRSPRTSPPASHEDKGKRKASTSTKTTSGQQTRAVKKKKTAQVDDATMLISPTLMTWVLGAGVMVLVSVVGFGAGFVIGREVGRQEALGGLNGSTIPEGAGSCGREVARGGLRRFKWGGGMRSVVA